MTYLPNGDNQKPKYIAQGTGTRKITTFGLTVQHVNLQNFT